MTMRLRLRTRFTEISTRLTRITENEPLSMVSIGLVVLLDLFILINLFNGLNEQTRQLTSPEAYIPTVCRQIIIEKNWVEETRGQELSQLILRDQRSYWEPLPDRKDKHPICRDLDAAITKMKGDKTLLAYFEERDKLVKRYRSYDSYQKQTDPETDKILADIRGLDEKINAVPVVAGFWAAVEAKSVLSATLTKDLRWINFTFPLKRLAVNILFLLPVIVVLYLWNSASIRKNRYLQTFISSHLLIVSFIPAFFEVCHAVFDLIPHQLFREIMAFLESWHLTAIWYYLLMIAAVAAALFLIYLFQKKVFTKERLMKRRLEKKKCIDCGRPLAQALPYCPFCGGSQQATCPHCRQETLQGASFCTRCGGKLP